jgi:hypothetical protein
MLPELNVYLVATVTHKPVRQLAALNFTFHVTFQLLAGSQTGDICNFCDMVKDDVKAVKRWFRLRTDMSAQLLHGLLSQSNRGSIMQSSYFLQLG